MFLTGYKRRSSVVPDYLRDVGVFVSLGFGNTQKRDGSYG